MKHLSYGIYCILFLLTVSVHGSDRSITSQQMVEIELFQKPTVLEKSIRVKDNATGKLLQVVLYPQGQSYVGRFFISTFRGNDKTTGFSYFENETVELASIRQASDDLIKIYLGSDVAELQKAVAETKKRPAPSTVKKEAPAPVKAPPPPPVNKVRTEAEILKKAPPQQVAEVKKAVVQEIKKQEASQLSIEQDEAQKRAARLEAASKLAAAEKQKRMDEATKLVAQADRSYQAGKFQEARDLYEKAIDKNPEDDSYYYRYGVTLYKLEDYNESVAILNMAEVPLAQSSEKTYYLGLNYLKLADYDKALKNFSSVKSDNHPELSPISSYMAGTILFQRRDFKAARANMDYILEASKDPALDRAADDMLDQIDRWERFLNSKKEKYKFSYNFGFNYDQNVLNISTDNISTDVSAYRLMYGVSARAYIFRSMESDLSASLSISDIYSVDKEFKNSALLQAADPLSFDLSIPYFVQLGSWGLDVNPFYRSVHMSTSGGSRQELIGSAGVSLGGSKPLANDKFMSLKMDVSSENYKIDVTSDDDNQSGTKAQLTGSYTQLLDLKGDRSWNADLGYLINNATGKNYYYQKAVLGGGYSSRLSDKWSSSYRLEYANQNYSKATTARTDNVITASGNATRNWGIDKSLNLGLQYNLSESASDSYDYNKWSLTAMWTQSWSILEQ